MGVRINTVMQTCFFKLAGVLPEDEAIAAIKAAIEKTYGKKGGGKVVQCNFAAVDGALAALHEVTVPETVTRNSHPSSAGTGRRRLTSSAMFWARSSQPWRWPAGQCHAGRRDIPHCHHPVRKTGRCTGHSHLGRKRLYSMWTMLVGLPTRRDSHEKSSMHPHWKALPRVRRRRRQGQGFPGPENDAASRPRRLHGLWSVCRDLPRQKQRGRRPQSDQHGPLGRPHRCRAEKIRFLPLHSRYGSRQRQNRHLQRLAVVAALVRVLGRMCRAAARRHISSCLRSFSATA